MSGRCKPPSHGTWHAYEAALQPTDDLETTVHVWRVRWRHLPPDAAASLSADERARAARFRSCADRGRFIGARAILRRLLAACLRRADDTGGRGLSFGLGPAGKPYLVGDQRLQFNVSHAGELVLIAVTRVGEVGIDVEALRPVAAPAEIARLVFDPAEREALQAAAPAEATAQFFRLWTHKEALWKALGTGIMGARDASGGIAVQRAARAWTLCPLPQLDGYAGALAHPRHAESVRLWCYA